MLQEMSRMLSIMLQRFSENEVNITFMEKIVSPSVISPCTFRRYYQSVHLLLYLTLCDPMDCSTPGFSITSSWSLLKLMSIELVMPSKHLTLCQPLLLPSIFPSIRVFSNESSLCIRWPMFWSFSVNISPSNKHPKLISFRMDWLDLLAVQGTLKSLLQHHSSKASVLWSSAFFIVQCSHPHMTNGKTIALTRGIFAGKVMSLLFNMLSSFVIIAFQGVNVSLFQSPSAVILEPPK